MIYAALAAVIVAALAWDFGRRWLTSHERAKEAALIRTREMRDEFSDALLKTSAVLEDKYDDALKAVAELRTVYGDAQSTINLRVREQRDLIAAVEVRLGTLSSEQHELRDMIGKSEPVDLTKHNAAVINLGKQLNELSNITATRQHVQEQLDAIEKRINATMTGAVAKGMRIRA